MGRRLDTWPYGRTATMDVTYTQANAGGGAVVCEISPGAGCEFIILDLKILNSGTNGIQVFREQAIAGNQGPLFVIIASGVATNCNVGVGTVSTAGAATTASDAGLGYPNIVSGAQALRIQQTGAGVQNDTFRIIINLRVKGGLPTVTHANSTNPANVSVTAGAESFATV